MSLAEKEHIWRICKKWVNDDVDEEPSVEEKSESSVEEVQPPPPEPQEEMVPKRLYDEQLRHIALLKQEHEKE